MTSFFSIPSSVPSKVADAIRVTDSTALIAECTCGACYDARKLEHETFKNAKKFTHREAADLYRTPCCGEFPQHWARNRTDSQGNAF